MRRIQRNTKQGFQVFNVWHIGAWNRNVGDWALAYHMHKMLNEQGERRKISLTFYQIDSQRTFFHPGLIDQMNEEADLVLVGGGGLIFYRPEDKSVSGWSFNISLPELAKIRPPIVVYGVGYNSFRYDSNVFPEITGEHLRQLQRKTALFSVRTNGTKKILIERYRLDRGKFDVIPDPGICLYDRPILIPTRNNRRPVIALNWAGDRPHLRYPPPHEKNSRHLMHAMKIALLRCVKDLNAQIMFLPHLLHVDSDMYDEFADGFPDASIFSTHQELPFLYPPPGELLYPHIPFFTNLFRQADLLIGMRFHACVLAFGASTRFIPLGSHPKVRYFMEDVGTPDYSIPLVDPERETADVLFEKIRDCLLDAGYAEYVKKELGSQLHVLRAFNERILDLLGEAVG